MKHVFALLFFAMLFASCKSDTTSTTDGSYLISTPDAVTLEKTDSVKTLDMKLSCGCGFTLQVTGMNGDTNLIKFVPLQNLGDTLSQHSMTFSYSPSSAKSGQVSLSFLARKHSYTYTTTVSVKTN